MDVTITQLRKDLFKLVDKAMSGQEVRVSHKGAHFRIVPEKQTGSKLSRVTKANYIKPGVSLAKARKELRKEMKREWEKDWLDL